MIDIPKNFIRMIENLSFSWLQTMAPCKWSRALQQVTKGLMKKTSIFRHYIQSTDPGGHSCLPYSTCFCVAQFTNYLRRCKTIQAKFAIKLGDDVCRIQFRHEPSDVGLTINSIIFLLIFIDFPKKTPIFWRRNNCPSILDENDLNFI